MTRTRDWDVVTGWEKRIKVDFGSIGPNHVRWSDWTWKERDIVARKVHEKTGIDQLHGPRSNRAEHWAKENAPIMIDFARDGKPMPDWAHADYQPSGVPEYVQIKWTRQRPGDPTSPADWAYDPPAPWTDPGEEPAWSARPMEPGYDPNPGASPSALVLTHRIIASPLKWIGDKLVLPIAHIVYPPGKDELLAMVHSKDPTRGGWVTMSALEALGTGANYTETVRDAPEINFVVPLSYSIQDQPKAAFKLYFRKSNGGMQRPDYIDYEMAVPPMPAVRELDESGGMLAKFGGVITYRVAPNGDHIANDGTVISTAESRAKEDVPDWRKFELGRLEEVDGIILPGPNALPQDEERFGQNRLHSRRHQTQQRQQPQPQQQRPGPDPDRIMPTDPNYTPMEKALSWAAETHHGEQHRSRWRCAAAALGATPEQLIEAGGDGTAIPMTLQGALKWWEQFGRNARWSMLIEALEEVKDEVAEGDPDIVAANRYREAVGLPPVQKSQSEKLREALTEVNERPDVVVREFDPEAGEFREIKMSPEAKHARDMDYYNNAPPMQAHYTREEWVRMNGSEPDIVLIYGWRRLAILDPGRGVPNYWLEGEDIGAGPMAVWEYYHDGVMPDWRERPPSAQKHPPTRTLPVMPVRDTVPPRLPRAQEEPGSVDTEAEEAVDQVVRTATLREVYDNFRHGTWNDDFCHPLYGWCVEEDPNRLIRYPDIIQPDESVPLPDGASMWTPFMWLGQQVMKPHGFPGDFEGFLRWHEAKEAGSALLAQPAAAATPMAPAQKVKPGYAVVEVPNVMAAALEKGDWEAVMRLAERRMRAR